LTPAEQIFYLFLFKRSSKEQNPIKNLLKELKSIKRIKLVFQRQISRKIGLDFSLREKSLSKISNYSTISEFSWFLRKRIEI